MERGNHLNRGPAGPREVWFWPPSSAGSRRAAMRSRSS